MDAQANEALKTLLAKTGTQKEYKYLHHVVNFSYAGANSSDAMSNELTALQAHGWQEYHYHCDVKPGLIIHCWVLCREVVIPPPPPPPLEEETVIEKNLHTGGWVKLPTGNVTMVISKQGERYRVEDGSVWDEDDLVVVPSAEGEKSDDMSFGDAIKAGAGADELKAIGNRQAVKKGLDELLKDKPHLSFIREHGAKAYRQLCDDRVRTVYMEAAQKAYQPIQFPPLGVLEVR